MCSYRAADLCLCFRKSKKPVFSFIASESGRSTIASEILDIIIMSHVMRKAVSVVSNQVLHKWGCTATENG